MDVILGAGSGIGAAYAGVVAEHNPSGAGVVLADITVEPASRVAERLGLTEAVIAHADLGDRSSLDALAAQLDDLGVLVLTAGVSPSMASAEVVLDIDLAGVARALDAFESKVVAGSVAVVMASIMGHMAPATDVVDVELDNPLAPDLVGRLVAAGANAGEAGHAYMLAKRGVLRLARRRALEWGAKGGRVVSVSPGVVDTPMVKLELGGRRRGPMQRFIDATPLGSRMASPREIADAIAFLASPQARFVTGADLLVDGGLFAKQC